MSNPQRGKSYSQVMNEWAAQRSFVNRLRSRLIHPPYDAPWYGKVWGYAWRLGSLTLIVLSVGHVALKSRFAGGSFRGHIGEEMSKRYHATNVTCGRISFPLFQPGVQISAIGADGTPDSVFNRVDAYELGFDLGWQYLKTDWNIDRLRINRMEMALKSGSAEGSSESDESQKPGSSPSNLPDRVVAPQFKTGAVTPKNSLLTAGFGLNPNFGDLKIHSSTVGDLSMNWGFSTTTAGSIQGASAVLEEADGDALKLSLTGGKFSQNWLSGLKVENVESLISQKEVTFGKAFFTYGEFGRVAMDGSLALGNIPSLEFKIAGENLPLRPFISAPFNKYLEGNMSFSGTLNGTINRSTGVTTKLNVKLVPPPSHSRTTSVNDPEMPIAYFNNGISIFRSLYVASGEEKLVQPGITSGTFQIESGGGVLKLSKIDLRGGDLFRIKGSMEVREELEVSTKAPSLNDANDAAPKLTYSSKGELVMGFETKLVKRLPVTIQHQFFTQDDGGFCWVRIAFQNEDGSELTKSIGDEINRLHLESLAQKQK